MFASCSRVGENPRGPRRKPGASSYTLTRLSLSLSFSLSLLVRIRVQISVRPTYWMAIFFISGALVQGHIVYWCSLRHMPQGNSINEGLRVVADAANNVWMAPAASTRLYTMAVPRIYEIWSRRAPTFIWPIRPVCQCRSLNELLVRKLSYGQVTCARSLRELPIRLQSGSRIDQFSSMRGTVWVMTLPWARAPS